MEHDNKFCSNCGASLENGAKTCIVCGESIQKTVLDLLEPAEQKGEATEPKPILQKGEVAEPHPPLPPQTPPNPSVSLAEAIRRYFKTRNIWQTSEGKFVLNDEFSKQVRRDTARWGIPEKYRVGIA